LHRQVKGSPSLNPGGRPKSAALRKLARFRVREQVEEAHRIAFEAKRPSDRIAALRLLWEFSWPKPAAGFELSLGTLLKIGPARLPELSDPREGNE